MAADTKTKRLSVMLLGCVRMRLEPEPDGSLANFGDRSHIAGMYSGFTPAVAAEGSSQFMFYFEFFDDSVTTYEYR